MLNMTTIVIILAMSIDIGGIGGFLAGALSRSLKRALLWACLWGAINSAILLSNPSYNFGFLPVVLALLWALIAWLLIGRRRVQKRSKTG